MLSTNNKQSVKHEIIISIFKSGVFSFILSILISLLIFYPFLQRNAVSHAKTTAHAILDDIDNRISYIENYTEYIAVAVEQNSEIQNYFSDFCSKNQTSASVMLNNFSSYINTVRGIIICDENNFSLDSMTNLTQTDFDIVNQYLITDMNRNTFTRKFTPVYQTNISHKDYYSVAYARNFYQNTKWYTIILIINLNSMINNINTLATNNLDQYSLIDNYNNTFYFTDHNYIFNDIEKKQSTQTDYIYNNQNYIFEEQSYKNSYKVVASVNIKTILSMLLPYYLGLFICMFSFLLLTLLLISKNINHLITPIIELSKYMNNAAKGELKCFPVSEKKDEIGTLEKSYNHMINELNNNIQIISEKEAHEQQMRFSLLISQIDPHFICNTINNITYLARKQNYQEIIKVNNALIIILRDRLRVNDIQITDTIENEKKVVEQYLSIIRSMYDSSLTITYRIPDELSLEQIPKNMIQPLVENALFHGLLSEEGELKGSLIIELYKTNNKEIALSVTDNGNGMSEEKIIQLQTEAFLPENRGLKIGLENIKGRLYYLYNKQDCLSIKSAKGKGTTVTILFPINQTIVLR